MGSGLDSFIAKATMITTAPINTATPETTQGQTIFSPTGPVATAGTGEENGWAWPWYE